MVWCSICLLSASMSQYFVETLCCKTLGIRLYQRVICSYRWQTYELKKQTKKTCIILSLPFGGDVALLVYLDHDLQGTLGRLDECEAAGIRISSSTSEIMVLNWKKTECFFSLPQIDRSSYVMESGKYLQ